MIAGDGIGPELVNSALAVLLDRSGQPGQGTEAAGRAIAEAVRSP